jgi:hypothetical protein
VAEQSRQVDRVFGRSLSIAQNAPPVRVLMADGKWLVPPTKRPKLAPPPKEHKRDNPMTRIRGVYE